MKRKKKHSLLLKIEQNKRKNNSDKGGTKMFEQITFQDIKKNKEISVYLTEADNMLQALHYTDHGAGHVTKVSELAAEILKQLGYEKRDIELARIAGYIHDIGNVINRVEHAQSGAIMAFSILNKMGMDPKEIAMIIGAIGNHDEDTGIPVSPIAAALILADKTDVRRSRVRNKDKSAFDIHDRVNYAVEKSKVTIDSEKKNIILEMIVDTDICSLMDYFEIFLARMLMCKRAAEFLGLVFELKANGIKLI